MPHRIRARVISPAQANATGEAGSFPFNDFGLHILAQGDSWFSIGDLPPWNTTRIVDELTFTSSSVIVNCAQPGARLTRMVDTAASRLFALELTGRLARKYDAIVFSGGGNDLIEAAGSPPEAPLDRRLLRTRDERGADATAALHVSEPGWRTFADHIGAVFARLLAARDSGINRGVPLVLHNYAPVVPRPAGAGLGSGPWLLPPLERYEVAPDMRVQVSDELTSRLSFLLRGLVDTAMQRDRRTNAHLVDSLGSAGITPAAAETRGESGDWINEIHLTAAGYRKCARVWEPVLDAVIG